MKVAWERLIRFIATDGRTLYGEPILPSRDFDLGTVSEQTGLKAKVISGNDIYDTTGQTKVTDEVVAVRKLLGPLTPEDIPILRCVGLNYMKHSLSIAISKNSALFKTNCKQSLRLVELRHLFLPSSSNRTQQSQTMAVR